MKRHALLILILFLMASLLPFAEPSEVLEDANTQNQTSGFYMAELVDPTPPIIKSSSTFSCSLANNDMKCWGNAGSGQLGIGSLNSQTRPQPVSFGLGGVYATEITLGHSGHACAVINDGSARCWGTGQHGRIGDGTGDNKQSPSPVAFSQKFASNTTATAISAGDLHTCAILNYGNVSCWGSGGGSAIGIPLNNNDQYFPQVTNSLGVGRTAVNISLGYQFACVLLDNGLVSCWGEGNYGQMGNGNNIANNPTPTPTNSFGANRTVVAIASGYDHTCVILDNGSVSCWGQNSYGALGRGTVGGYSSNPALTNSLGPNRTAVYISAGYQSTCVVLDNGEAKCWGYNPYGQLGDGTNLDQSSPTTVLISLELNVSSIVSQGSHTCAVFENGHATCWGQGSTYGLFGDGTYSNRILPSLRYSEQTQIYNVENSAVENLPVSFRLQGTIFDDMNLSSSNVSIDLPVGLNFNPNNKTITGSPSYTAQTNWNITISNGTQQRTATYELQILADTDGDGTPNTLDTDDDNDGFGDPSDACPTQVGNSTEDLFGCPDNDGDGYSNSGDAFVNDYSQYIDTDQDGFGDNVTGFRGDYCPLVYGESTRNDVLGCPDSDFDGWADFQDLFVSDSSQWNDTDLDGFGDELNGFEGDACPLDSGNSTADRFGCLDSDGDGYSDLGDDLPYEQTQWSDRDGDGYGDNQEVNANMVDYFPSDGTQWNDTDGDGHGDNPYGSQGDWFPNDPNRWQDSDQDGVANKDDAFPNNPTQSIDSDGDGYGDDPNGTDYDDFPFDANEWLDTDSDGFGDNSDQYPYDPSQSVDSDGDGFGDNTNGTRGDAFPEDGSEWLDTDGDGVGDNSDDLPFNPSQTSDADSDGFGDDPTGTGADPFPNDPTQWVDADGDGYGDNAEGNNPDLFPRDITQWFDRDGDGFGDNRNGVNPDAFPDDSTQWVDDDGDGFGDNPNGTNPDPSINDYDNDGYLDNDDPFPQISSPGDKDNDGVLDENDAFPDNFREFADNDGDGDGDIEDLDDDNDGYLDEDEIRSDSDPLDPNSQPVEGFEIIVPGTAISLGAWDLIGIFGGVPLFGWIGFGFLTRNKRCAKYEEQLKTATTRDELEKVALRWEYSLMLRMLGPHQGIRLERLRAELDDKFENATYDETEIGYDQTNLVENEDKNIPPINESFEGPTKETAATSTDESGYEWLKQGEENWYRPVGSDDEWLKFEE